ncbi:MAG: hypothetical protein ACQKBV_06535 [Puniceicoccales bacterium]
MQRLYPLRPFLLIASIIGFLTINMPFLYYTLIGREVYSAAMSNGLALVFIAEAFLLLALVAFLIAKLGWKKPGWFAFVVFSLVGSLAFSIPFFLYLHAKQKPADH